MIISFSFVVEIPEALTTGTSYIVQQEHPTTVAPSTYQAGTGYI